MRTFTFIIPVILSTIFTLVACIPPAGSPLVILDIDYLGVVNAQYVPVAGATLYYFTAYAGGSFVLSANAPPRADNLAFIGLQQGSCNTLTFAYLLGGVKSAESDTTHVCVPGSTARKTGGGVSLGTTSGNLNNYNDKSLFNDPFGFAFNAAFDMIIVDRGNNRLRSMTNDGLVSTVGIDHTLFTRVSNLAIHPSTDNIYVVDEVSRDIIMYDSVAGTTTSVATLPCGASTTGELIDIVNDGTDMFYIASGKCAAIYSFDSSTNTVGTVISGSGTSDGGSGSAGFLFPCSLYYDGSNNWLIIGDSPRNKQGAIRLLDLNSVSVTTFVGNLGANLGPKVDGDSSVATLGEINGITFLYTTNDILFADARFNGIRGVNYITGEVTTMIGGNPTSTDPCPSYEFTATAVNHVAIHPIDAFVIFSSSHYNALFVDHYGVLPGPTAVTVDSFYFTSVTLSFQDGYSVFMEYEITINPGNIVVTTTRRLGFVVNGLTVGTSYTVDVIGTDEYTTTSPVSNSFTTLSPTCGNSITEPTEDCDGGACCDPSTCVFLTSSTTCRSSAGACDIAETCSGSSATCPTDVVRSSSYVCNAASTSCEQDAKCDGSSTSCPSNPFQPSSHVCRASAGDCDSEEKCTGSSNSCPSDTLYTSSHVCRSAVDLCDAAETCDGSSVTCPTDAYQASGYTCRASAGLCDVAETCDGSTTACPTDGFKASSHVCRTASGDCDAAETCTGSSAACPTDGYQASGYVCRAAADDCDAAETCTGSSSSCPTDVYQASGYVCRASAGLCDVAETCSGSSITCPSDSFRASSHVCRAAAGDCDAAETCSGSSASCPTDAYQASGYVCRAANGACDAAETCSGSSTSCPTDAYQASGYVCRAAVDDCDAAETCSGSSTSCPTDVYQASGHVCRAAAGDCDVDETCDGTSTACPTDAFEPSSHVCRAAADLCDAAETCSGSSASCPTDAYKASSHVCRVAADLCDAAETCTGSSIACPTDVYQTSSHVCRTAAGDCDAAETCTGSSITCPTDAYQPSSHVCRAAVDDCDAEEKCSGSSITCPTDAYQPSSYVCRVAAGDCDVSETCTGSATACPTDAYQSSSHVCRASTDLCDAAETCSGSSATCPTDAYEPSSHVCRTAAGLCDAAETCTGSSAACPTDAYQSSSHVCRAAVGDCDTDETCTGSSISCPTDAYQPSSYVCRAAVGDCDAAETCTGSSTTCPTDALQPSSYVCRVAAGDCDVAEQCTGSSSTCPTDTYQLSTHVCRVAAGDCDVDETCSGSSATCPTDAFEPSSHVCRAAVGACDAAETCTGSSATCPTDAYQPSSHVCRAASGDCDFAETCTGSSTTCPTDILQPSSHVCRAAADDCDAAETCTGSSASCPTDVYQSAGYVCRATAGACDVSETCDGTSISCPTDQFAPSSQVCRTAAGDCDVSETCTGSSATCPTDAFEPSSHVCRVAAGDCDAAETCSGSSATCPTDAYKPSSHVCRIASGDCDFPETCTGSSITCPTDVLQPSSHVCRTAADDCDAPETCTGSSASCPTDLYRASGYVCRTAAGDCDTSETCDGTSISCPTDQFLPSSQVCRTAAGDCDVSETCTGSSATCPTDAFEPSSHVCRVAVGDCDAAETCTGSSATCPTDAYKPSSHVCRIASGDCDFPETCTGSSTTCPTDVLQPSSYVCRTAADDCDAPETCTGSSASCPTDLYQPSTHVCRVAAGDCDVRETCTGSSISCPTDQFSPSSQVCRTAAGDCDVSETCTGSSASCPADTFESSSHVCRVAVGDCDAAETCTGSSATCPTDSYKPSSHVCRTAVGDCDFAETCTGSSTTCPTDILQPSSHVCRAAADDCDAAETCTGTSASCPTDLYQPSTHVCRTAAGDCDVSETCDGSSISCPTDQFSPSSQVCRTAAGDCDTAETCTGSSASCPTDAYLPSSTVCRPSADDCDAADTCTGSSAVCPTDTYLPSGTLCRPAIDDCDADETCTGSSASCPSDALAPATQVCRAAVGDCDAAETCTGSSTACPADTYLPSSQQCRAASGDCDVADFCTGTGVSCPTDAVHVNGHLCRSAAGDCDAPETCDGTSHTCPTDSFLPLATLCRTAGSACDVSDYCSGTSAVCTDSVKTQGTVCRPAAGLCYTDPVCDGTTSICPTVDIPVSCSNNGTCESTSGACVCSNGNPFPYCNAPPGCTVTNTCECDPGKYGQLCVDCLCVHGICDDGRLGDGSCSCDSGWHGTLCDTHDAPQLVSAIFANSGASVSLSFSEATDQSGSASCTALFDSASLALFGTQATCWWNTASTLTVTFHNGAPTILPGDTITLLVGTVGSSQSPSDTAYGSVVVQAPASPTPVSITVQGLSTVGSCNSFTLVAETFGTGGRLVDLEWTLEDNGAADVATYNTVIHQYFPVAGSNSTSTLQAPETFLTPGNTYIINVSAINYLGMQGSTTHTITRSALSSPTVQIAGPSSLVLLTSTQVQLTGTVTSCSLSAGNPAYEWSVLDINTQVYLTVPGVVLTSSTCSIPPYALVAGHNYTVSLSGYFSSNPSAKGEASVSVAVTQQELVAQIAGGSLLSHPANASLVLDASSSYDPDRLASSLSYTWSVQVLFGKSFSVNTQSAILRVPPSSLTVNGSYIFTVAVSDSARVSQASIEVHITPAGAPVVSITRANSIPFRASDKLVLQGSIIGGYADVTVATYSWTELTGNLALTNPSLLTTSATSPNLVLVANALVDKIIYQFRLDVTTPTGSAYAQISVSTDPLPTGGIFVTTPSVGVALSTQFSLQCSGWQSFDGSSLQYSFSYILNGAQTPLNSNSFSSTLASTLPSPNTQSNTLTVVVDITDVYGGRTTAKTQVMVLGHTLDNVYETLNGALNSSQANSTALSLVTITTQIQALGGTIPQNLSMAILNIAHGIAQQDTDVHTTVYVAQLLSNIATLSPVSLGDPLFMDALTLVATSNTSSPDSRASVMQSVSTIYDNANSNVGFYDKTFSQKVAAVIDSVFITASNELVCGEQTSVSSKNVQMHVGRDYQNYLEGSTINMQDSSSSLIGSVYIPPGLFNVTDAPPCVGTQYIVRPQDAFLWAPNYTQTRLVSRIDSFALWGSQSALQVQNVPAFKIMIPIYNYTAPLCAPTNKTCEYVYCSYFNTSTDTWDTTGLTVATQGPSYIVCSSSHLTDFSLIVGLKNLGDNVGGTVDTFGKINGNPYAIIFVSTLFALYAVSIFTVWLVDAKQDIERIPIIDKTQQKKDQKNQLVTSLSVNSDTGSNHSSPDLMRKIPSGYTKHLALQEAGKLGATHRIPVTPHMIYSKVVKQLKRQHTWLAIYFRERHDHFNRIRRITVLLSIIMCIIAIAAISLQSTPNHISGTSQIGIAFWSSIFAIIPNLLIFLFFYKAKARYVDDVQDISSEDFSDSDDEEKEKSATKKKGPQELDVQIEKKAGWKGEWKVLLMSTLNTAWPWWWCAIAYIFAFVLILSSGYFGILYATQFNHTQLRAWFITCVAAVVIDACLTQVVAAVLAVCVRIAFKRSSWYQPPVDNQ